ncbi:MAG: ParB/RepB/Spo0J family partition protein [Clostridium celatum]|nr:ParB/RepB/Spo0J family partition protein [Clostridium celatum]
MAKFNMMELLNNNSKESLETKDNHERFKTIQISINDIVPSPNNFYSIEEEKLKGLKDSIELLGLQQNLVVKKIEKNKYEIIAGHRRYLAMKKLYEEGNINFEYIPCKVEDDDYIKNELKLLMTNSTTRELSDWEKITQTKKLKDLLTEYKKKEKLPGRVRDIIADILSTSPTQVARMESISKNLVEEFKDELKDDNIKISVAYELSKLPEDKQKEVFEEHQDKKDITIKTVKEKETEEEIEVLEGQITVEEALNITEDDLKVNTEEVTVEGENYNSTLRIDTSTGEVVEEKTISKFRNRLFIELEDANLNDRLRYDLLDLVQEYDELISKYKNNDLHINFISNSIDEGDIQIVLNSEGIEIKAVDHFDLIEIYNKVILIAH